MMLTQKRHSDEWRFAIFLHVCVYLALFRTFAKCSAKSLAFKKPVTRCSKSSLPWLSKNKMLGKPNTVYLFHQLYGFCIALC